METPASFPEKTLAFLLLRLWLAQRAIVAGLDKFSGTKTEKQYALDEFGNQDLSGAMIEVKQKFYSFASYHGLPEPLAAALRKEPLMPGFLLNIYSATLGYALIALGLALLLGVFTRTVLFLMGLIYISLTLGLMLLNQNDGVAWLGIHVFLVAVALVLASHNRFALTKRF